LSKAIQPWWQTFRWWRRNWNGGAEVAEATITRLALAKRWDTCINAGEGYVEK
jgi:hypothetical protein